MNEMSWKLSNFSGKMDWKYGNGYGILWNRNKKKAKTKMELHFLAKHT
jgi:hypothetical protein